MLKAIGLCLTFALLTTGCYRFPGEDEYSLIPTTNNRDLTREKDASIVPNVKY